MIKPGKFRIAANHKWWYVMDGSTPIRRFSTASWSHEEVKAWRAGYVAGLNAANLTGQRR